MVLHTSVQCKINSQTEKLEQKKPTSCVSFLSRLGQYVRKESLAMESWWNMDMLFPVNICEIDGFPFSWATLLLRKEDNWKFWEKACMLGRPPDLLSDFFPNRGWEKHWFINWGCRNWEREKERSMAFHRVGSVPVRSVTTASAGWRVLTTKKNETSLC